jgi:hypothetical protein
LIVAQDEFAAWDQVTGIFTVRHGNCKDILQNHTLFVLNFKNYHLEYQVEKSEKFAFGQHDTQGENV